MLFLSYNHHLVGSYSLATYPQLSSEFKLQDPQADGFWDNLKLISRFYWRNLEDTVPQNIFSNLIVKAAVILPALALNTVFKPKNQVVPILASIYILLVLMYNFHEDFEWTQYGARYYYPGLASIAVLAAFSLEKIFKELTLRNFSLFIGAILLIQLLFLNHQLGEYGKGFDFNEAVYREIYETCPEKSIVVFKSTPRNWTKNRPSIFHNWWDFKRNPFQNESRIFVVSRIFTNDTQKQVSGYYPGYSVCHFDFDQLKIVTDI